MIDPRTVPIRYSHLKSMAKSPAHYFESVQDHREETLAMRLGSGTHALLFGTPAVVVYRGGEMVDAKGKTKTYTDVRSGALWEAFEKEHAGACILSETELAKATAMARAITSDMAADSLLFAPGAEHEKEVSWTYRGRKCRGRFDAITADAIPDVKSTRDASPKWFPRQAAQMFWTVQGCWYADGAEAAGLGWRQPYIVAVESSPPYPVTVWRMPEETIAESRRIYQGWFETLLRCEADNVWPGYSGDVLDLEIPYYMRQSFETGAVD